MNEFDDDNEANKVIEIINNTKISGYICINSVFKHGDEYFIIPEDPYTKNPQNRNQSLFLVTNENDKLKVNMSLISDEAINYIKNVNYTQNGIESEHIRQVYNFLVECKSYLQKEFCNDESFAELIERFGTIPSIELDFEYTVSYTEKLICNIFGIQFDKGTSSLVDGMLSDLFGSVKIKDENTTQSTDDLSSYLNDPEFNLEYDNTPAEEQSSDMSFNDFLENLGSKFNCDKVIEVDKESQLESVENNPNFYIIRDLIDVIHIVSAEDSIQCEEKFNTNLNTIIGTTPDSNMGLNEYSRNFVRNFSNAFYSNVALKAKLYKVVTDLTNEIEYYNSIEMDDEALIKYIKIKNILFQDIKQHFDYYTLLNKNASLNSNVVLEIQEMTYFALLFQLSHLINKTKLKNENEIYIKSQNIHHITDNTISEILINSMDYETTIVDKSNQYLDEFRSLIQTVITEVKE